MPRLFFCLCLIHLGLPCNSQILLPVDVNDRTSLDAISLTEIGEFGIIRKARPSIPAHHHTGIDIQRPEPDYQNPVYIFPIAHGTVISKREDGPFAQLIIEHNLGSNVFWTVYEHIGGIQAGLHQEVYPQEPIARFYTRNELDTYGWQFDHFHFEVLKTRPYEITPSTKTPERHFSSYTLVCYDTTALDRYFYNPLEFLEEHTR